MSVTLGFRAGLADAVTNGFSFSIRITLGLGAGLADSTAEGLRIDIGPSEGFSYGCRCTLDFVARLAYTVTECFGVAAELGAGLSNVVAPSLSILVMVVS